MTAAGTVYCDAPLVSALPKTAARIVEAPFSEEARKVDRLGIGPLALGYLAAATGIVSVEALGVAIESSQKGPVAAKNMASMKHGAALAAKRAI